MGVDKKALDLDNNCLSLLCLWVHSTYTLQMLLTILYPVAMQLQMRELCSLIRHLFRLICHLIYRISLNNVPKLAISKVQKFE